MERTKKRKPPTGLLIGGGLVLVLESLLLWSAFEDLAPIGLLLGVVAILAGVGLGWNGVREWLVAYALAGAFVLILVFTLFFLPSWAAEKITFGGKLHPWIARFLLVVLLQGLAFVVWTTLRDRESFEAKRAAVAANVTVLIEVAVALVILVNWFGANHMTRLVGSWDATELKVYTLGDRTEKLLDSLSELPSPVHAVYLDFGTANRSYGGPALGSRGKDFLKQYADASPKVVVREFDALRDLAEAEDYLRKLGARDLEFGGEDTVVFLYKEPDEKDPNRKDVTVRSYDFISTSQLGTRKFKGEQIFTSAIQEVVLPKKRVYILEGHGENPLVGSARNSLKEAADLIRKLSVEIETLNLANAGRMPDDADLLWIPVPKAPLLAAEREAITDWLDAGGSLLLMLEPQTNLLDRGADPWQTGLEDYLAKMGVVPKPDYVCMDYEVAVGRSQAQLLKTTALTTTDYTYHPVVRDLMERDEISTMFPNACPVVLELPEDAEDVKAEEIVFVRRSPPSLPQLQTYAAKLFPGRDPRRENAADILGEHISIGVASERTRMPEGEDAEPVRTRIVVLGDGDFATSIGLNAQSQYYAVGNPTLLANAVSWTIGREELISIDPKTLESERVSLTEHEREVARGVALYALPALVLFLAIGTAWRRRR